MNEEKIKEKDEELKEWLVVYDKYGAPLVEEYANELDKKVKEINDYINYCRKMHLDYDVTTVQQYVMELANILYFVSDRVEKLGSLSDLAKMTMEMKYSEAYVNKQGKNDAGTKYSVEQLKSIANNAVLEEKVLKFVYERAYKSLQAKVTQGETIRSSLNKILSVKIETIKKGSY